MKTLYFEGAGWAEADSSKATDVGNCRIRTAFTNNENKKIYIELGCGYVYGKNKKEVSFYSLYCDCCFYITEDPEIDDCNKSRLKYEYSRSIEYTKENILKFVNKICKCSFENIVVLPDLSGYRVHSDSGKYNTPERYNFMESYTHEPQLIELREEIQKHFYELEKSEGKKYPNFSLWVDENDKNLLHLLRHFNGYNKHWSIRTDSNNWKDSIQETKLGKYAC